MKRKNIALMLAAAMAVSGTMQTGAVLAAEFSDGEVFEEELLSEEAVPAEDFGEPEIFEEEFISGAAEAELFEDAEAVPAEAAEVKAAPVVGFSVTKEAFEAWRNGEGMDVEEINSAEGTTEDIFEKLPNPTGYAAVGFVEGQEGYADLVIPEGMNVAILGWETPGLNSITPNGNVMIKDMDIAAPGKLEIKEGAGSVTLRETNTEGMLFGSGANDTVRFERWNQVAGLKGVENIIFMDQEPDQWLNITAGPVEFYNISQENAEGKNININIEGYGADRIPVFHKDFDLGVRRGSDDQGNTWEDPGCVGVCYIKNFDVPEGQDWEAILPKQGAQFVKFDAPAGDIADMIGKMYLAWDMEGKPVSVEFDGTVFYGEKHEEFYYVERIVESDGCSAEQIYDSFGQREFPYGGLRGMGAYGTAKTLEAVLNADKGGSGYYKVNLPKASSFEKLTVPSGVKGIIYQPYSEYDEAADMEYFYPAVIKAIDVPQGKKMKIHGYKSDSGSLIISGFGEILFTNCRMNQKVTAKNASVGMAWCSVKELECHELYMDEAWMMAEDYLKFDRASILNSDIFAKAGAVLDFGEINNEGTEKGDLALNLEVRNGKMPQLYFAKAFNLGTVSYDGEEPREGILEIRLYDYAKMAAMGSNTTKDIYGDHFDVWNEDESKNCYANCIAFADKAESVFAISREAAERAEYIFNHLNLRYEGCCLYGNLEKITDTVVPLDCYIYDSDISRETKAYLTIGAFAPITDLSKGSIAAIKNQYYTGKALTPAVTVKAGDKTLKKGTDYTVAYTNNTKAGTAKVTVTGIGSYVGTITKTFKIVYNIPKLGSKHAIGTLKYIVTKAASSGGTVMVYAPVKKTYTSVVIPASVKINGIYFKVTAVYKNTFKNNKNLKSVTIGKYVTAIGDTAFYGDSKLKSIVIQGTGLKSAGKYCFKGIYSKAKIKVPSKVLKSYTKLLKGKGQSSKVTIVK